MENVPYQSKFGIFLIFLIFLISFIPFVFGISLPQLA